MRTFLRVAGCLKRYGFDYSTLTLTLSQSWARGVRFAHRLGRSLALPKGKSRWIAHLFPMKHSGLIALFCVLTLGAGAAVSPQSATPFFDDTNTIMYEYEDRAGGFQTIRSKYNETIINWASAVIPLPEAQINIATQTEYRLHDRIWSASPSGADVQEWILRNVSGASTWVPVSASGTVTINPIASTTQAVDMDEYVKYGYFETDTDTWRHSLPAYKKINRFIALKISGAPFDFPTIEPGLSPGADGALSVTINENWQTGERWELLLVLEDWPAYARAPLADHGTTKADAVAVPPMAWVERWQCRWMSMQ